MGRAPCCEKMGLKKGPWTAEEDQLLISYIHHHGHPNWRALPKQAGLLRCGKSCRLRWVNYLKPDIKRGHFTPEEEEAIIKLHEMLGNRWSAIAARLPGRTDNEIKNVWHTHLKKRLSQNNQEKQRKKTKAKTVKEEQNSSSMNEEGSYSAATEVSSLTEASSMESFPIIDESFWTENLSVDGLEIPTGIDDAGCGLDHEMDFWYNVFIQAGEGGSPELPEF